MWWALLRGRSSGVATPTSTSVLITTEGIHVVLSVAVLGLDSRGGEHGTIGALSRLVVASWRDGSIIGRADVEGQRSTYIQGKVPPVLF